MRLVFLIIKCLVAAACLALATQVRAPFTAEWRPWLLIVLVVIPLAVAAASLGWRKWSGRKPGETARYRALCNERRRHSWSCLASRQVPARTMAVLSASPEELEPLGRHVIVGYRDAAFVRELVERRAIAGIFLTDRNVARRGRCRHRARDRRACRRSGHDRAWRRSGSRPIRKAALSRGCRRRSIVSRRLSTWFVAQTRGPPAGRGRGLCRETGPGLERLGVNLNFAPVVDLDFGMRNPNDAYTRSQIAPLPPIRPWSPTLRAGIATDWLRMACAAP